MTYGLGIGISDLNDDGWSDFYVSNDYTIPDYLYMNNQDGTFTDKLSEQLGHTSHFSMGNDIADINNDGRQDIFTLDMLPEDNRRQKLLLAPDNYEKFELNLRSGFHHQYMRNMLQLNNGNGTFSEIGQLAGISNTDWSWAPLFADYDNDGHKDLYVTNGYFRDYTNLDFINYMDDYVKSKGRLKREDVLEIIRQMPSSNLTNYYFSNNGGITFSDNTAAFGFDQASNSNGAAYADLDNDGDLDLIVNNINKFASIYRNETNKKNTNYLQITLKGIDGNTRGIGSKVTLYAQGKQQCLEQLPTRGYLSTVSTTLQFGLGKAEKIDSLKIRWNNGKEQLLRDIGPNQMLVLDENEASHTATSTEKSDPLLKEIQSPINHKNTGASVNDFKRQSLLIYQPSHSGPCLAKGDINNDGLEDVFIGGTKGQAAALYVQRTDKGFSKLSIEAFESDKEHHDADAVIFDADNDGNLDIYVGSGGYHDFTADDALLQDRLYFGDGIGNFSKNELALPKNPVSTGCIAVEDINADGAIDLFIGGRIVPGMYPASPKSQLLINDGDGKFSEQTEEFAPELIESGMITDAVWSDVDQDGRKDLVVVGEWMPISIYLNTGDRLVDKTDDFFNRRYQGWWNTLTVDDLNRDGRPDIVAGNMGTNTQFKVSDSKPATLLYGDFDFNESIDPLFSFFINGRSYPYITRDELLGQLAGKRSDFNTYESYAEATVEDILSKEEINAAKKLTANHLETSLFLSTNKGKYEIAPLPVECQFAPVYTVSIADFNGDTVKDLLFFGNNDYFKLRLGKFDANYGTLVLGNGEGGFGYIDQTVSGLDVQGSVHSSLLIDNRLFLGIYEKPIKAYEFATKNTGNQL